MKVSLSLLLILLYEFVCYGQFMNDYEIERNALILFYKSTNGNNWTNNTNWLSEKPLDVWHGITLDDNGYVSEVGLGSNNLIGHINEEFGSLKNLNYIDFGSNYLTGSIPQSFANFTEIYYLSLNSNYLEGSMLFLKYYQMLQQLYAENTLITGPLALNSNVLTVIYCPNNYFSGSVTTGIFNDYLGYFNIQSNFLSGTIPNLTNNSILNSINIMTNLISGTFPQLPYNLLYMYADENFMTGPLTVSWKKYQYLRVFQITSNILTGLLTNVESPSLVAFKVGRNSFTGYAPSLTNINNYKSIVFLFNYFTGSLQDNFDKSCQLQEFINAHNYFEGSLPSSLGYCVFLGNLALNVNYFSGTISSAFKSFVALEYFVLSENILSGALPNLIVNNMKSLLNFVVSMNKLEGSIPNTFSSQNFLQILFLYDNLFTGTMPLLSNSILVEIDFSNNFLTGSIPLFTKLTRYLIASDNFLIGQIEIVDNYLLLLSYEVSKNYLTGSIPSNLANIIPLSAFYVDSNYLTGSLSLQLCTFNNLRLLNINALDMCVPSCLTRAAYSVSSYDFIRCQNEQDLALCSMIQQTDVYDKLSSSVEYITQVYESTHPTNDLDNSSYFNLVNISGAYKYVLTFDDWTQYDAQDTLRVCADYACNKVIKSYENHQIPGINGNEPLEIYYSYFYIDISSGFSFNYYLYWGYLVTVTAYFPLIGWNCTSPPIISQSYDDETLSKYNLTLSNSYAVDICSSNNWRGIECTFVSVTSLFLESYGISGTIPSGLFLLTALEQLSLSYNSFFGSLPESIGNLTNVQILDLSNNKLSFEIPSELGQLTQLQYLYLQSNDLIGTIPESLAYLNESLQLMSLSANQLSGKLTNDLCSLSNASIDVSGNNLICYEECWDNVNGKSLKSGYLSICAPTSYPTSQPSSPTHQPTNANSSSKSSVLIIYVGLVAVTVVLISIYFIYRCFNTKEMLFSIARKNALQKLPIHRYMLQKKSINEILQIIRYASSTLSNEDYDGNNVIDLAIKYKLNNEIVIEILKQLLSIHIDDVSLSINFKYAWIRVIQSDLYIDSVRHIFDVYFTLSRELSDCLDENGRSAVNIASPLCRQAIKESLYFLRRYDFGSNVYPTHVSETSIIYIAVDTLSSNENNKRVAIKFISNKDSYLNEIRSRMELSKQSDSIIPVIDSFNAFEHSNYDFEIRRRNLDKYLYCIVMPAGEKNLGNIIATERIAGKDWTQLKVITTQLALSINQLHSKQYIHGDIKPLNVIRLGNEIKLIDLDACAKVGCDSYGSKYSQAYVPPEFIYKDNIGRVYVKVENFKSFTKNIPSYHSLDADYSQDSWSLGMLLYELYTGMSFFLKDYDDNIDIESLELLYEFDDDMKQKKLSKISDRFARNLVSLLLDKDPNKRLSMTRVLEHPFISGKSAVRLEGEEAEYDMFISYRVSSDLHHAEKINDLLTTQRLKVWFDKTSLLPGKNWEEGFSDGLVKSRVLVPIISRNSLNHPTNPRSNITLLDENSPCDNVLLEYALALELKERGLLTQIYPVLIGDFDDDKKEYLDYFASGCYPKDVKNIIVKSVDVNVISHLNRLGLGSRLTDNEGVKNIIESIFKSQGIVLKGPEDNSFATIIKDVESMKLSTR